MANPKFFFATKADLEPGLKKVEAWLSIKYIEWEFHKTPHVPEYYSALDIPEFGLSIYGGFYDATYLILPADMKVRARRTPQDSGETLYLVDRESNPEGFWLRPGGWYTKEERRYLIGGEVAGFAQDAEVKRMFSRYIRTLTKGFTMVTDRYGRQWWIGPEAMEAFKAGIRLVREDVRNARRFANIPAPGRLRPSQVAQKPT